MTKSTYSGESISVLEGLEAVRVRPGMYIGSTNSRGLHHLVWEILDNSIDEHLAGFCDEIVVTLHKNHVISVKDNGRGIPVDVHPKKKIATERIIFTTLHAGGKFNSQSYRISGGLHGVGASVVNALSSFLEVEIIRDGFLYRDRYENGGNPVVELVDGELLPVEEKEGSGTKITFKPDETIFETTEFKADIIKKRLKELAFLNKGLKIVFIDEIHEETITYHEKDGIVGFVKYLNESKDIKHKDVIYVTGKSKDIEVEIAIQYTKEFTESIHSFCNNVNTIEGGLHVSGFKTALTRIVNQYARDLGSLKEKENNFEGRDVRNGIVAVLSIKHPDPQYEGQTKTKLGNSDAKSAVEEVLSEHLPVYFDKNPETVKLVIDNAMKSYKLRKVEEKARTNFLSKNATLQVNGKLASCSSRKPEECELIIVEGDSAGGSAKQGRNRKFQAIMPIRGKILNVEKSSMDRIMSNQEIISIISAFGCGFGDDFDIKKARYHKIIILTDADVDGSHIRTLLLTFFYRYMPELIHEGFVYIGIPPLYKVTMNKKIQYLYSDKELEQFRKENKSKKFELQRYKGLGEMNPEQLWETTLNPKTRYLKKVTIEDAVACDKITTLLMGSKIPPRREFIMEKAKFAEIDV